MNSKAMAIDTLMPEIFQHALEEYPEECCGMIFAGRSVRCKNMANLLHQANPENHVRTASSSFALSAKDMLFLVRSLGSSDPVTIVYHSHPDVGAYFSEEDLAFALFENMPTYPIDYLVIDVRKEGVYGANLYQFDGTTYSLARKFPNPKRPKS